MVARTFIFTFQLDFFPAPVPPGGTPNVSPCSHVVLRGSLSPLTEMRMLTVYSRYERQLTPSSEHATPLQGRNQALLRSPWLPLAGSLLPPAFVHRVWGSIYISRFTTAPGTHSLWLQIRLVVIYNIEINLCNVLIKAWFEVEAQFLVDRSVPNERRRLECSLFKNLSSCSLICCCCNTRSEVMCYLLLVEIKQVTGHIFCNVRICHWTCINWSASTYFVKLGYWHLLI